VLWKELIYYADDDDDDNDDNDDNDKYRGFR
jgi:hypothetical protein